MVFLYKPFRQSLSYYEKRKQKLFLLFRPVLLVLDEKTFFERKWLNLQIELFASCKKIPVQVNS